MTHLTPQEADILAMLEEAGMTGINSMGKARGRALQLPSVISRLEDKGYSIKRYHREGTPKLSVNYVLLHTPPHLKDASSATTASQEESYEWQFVGGVALRVKKSETSRPSQEGLFE